VSSSPTKYKQFIDDLVRQSESVNARLCRKGRFRKTSAHAKYNELLASLSPSQRDLLADLLSNERSGGFHDFLVYLTDREAKLLIDDEELPTEPFGTESFFDFVARSAGDAWPDEN